MESLRSLAALAFAALALSSAAPRQEKKWTQTELEAVSREIQAQLEVLRGEKFARPVAVAVSSKADLIEYVKQREAKTESPEKLAADEMVAKLLAVIPADLDLRAASFALLENQVGGFYDPDTDSFSLMESLPVGLTKVTLAHELDHALDDQLFGIDATLERIGDDTDASLAYHAVVEGSGTAVMTQWMRAHQGEVDLSEIGANEMEQLMSMGDAPVWMWKPLLGTYMAGAAFLQRTSNWITAQAQTAESADIRAAFGTPPRSTEQVLHPEKYWDPAQRDEPRAVRFDTAKLESGWKVLREDTLGEFLMAIVCTAPEAREKVDLSNPAALLAISFTHDIAEGWGGDRLALLGKENARILRWVTVWDTERDAGEFYGAMTQQLPRFEAAARALGGDPKLDSGAKLEYEPDSARVVITVHSGLARGDLRRVLRTVEEKVQ